MEGGGGGDFAADIFAAFFGSMNEELDEDEQALFVCDDQKE